MKYFKVLLCSMTLLHMSVICLSQDKPKRLVCSMADADEKQPVQLKETGEGVKVVPFSVSGATSIFKSILPLLKNLPVIKSPSDLPSTPIKTETQNVSLSCDVVSTGVKDQISKLESEVATLRGMIEKLEGKEICPGGFVYLDRCFRLMEIRGKQFSNRKAEDLCNFNGGVLAKIDSDLLFLRVSSYLTKKLLDPKYQNRSMIRVWLGMKYQLPPAPVTGGPFPFPSLGSVFPTIINSAVPLSSQTPPHHLINENLKPAFPLPSDSEPAVSSNENTKNAFSFPDFGLPTVSTDTPLSVSPNIKPSAPTDGNLKTAFSLPPQSQPTISTERNVNNVIPRLSSGSTRRNQKNRFLQWAPAYPTNTATYDRIALQFRFNRTHNRVISAGAVNLQRKRIALPLCQFYLNDWESVDSRSARLFRFID